MEGVLLHWLIEKRASNTRARRFEWLQRFVFKKNNEFLLIFFFLWIEIRKSRHQLTRGLVFYVHRLYRSDSIFEKIKLYVWMKKKKRKYWLQTLMKKNVLSWISSELNRFSFVDFYFLWEISQVIMMCKYEWMDDYCSFSLSIGSIATWVFQVNQIFLWVIEFTILLHI